MELPSEVRDALQRRLDEMAQGRTAFVRELEAEANAKIGRYDGAMAELRYILVESKPIGCTHRDTESAPKEAPTA